MKKLLIGLALLINLLSAQGQTNIGVYKLVQCPIFEIPNLTVPPAQSLDRLYAIDHKLYFAGLQIGGSTSIGSVNFSYEMPSDSLNTFTLSFVLQPSSQVFYNGKILRSSQWSGAGTSTITLNLDIKKYDYISVNQ